MNIFDEVLVINDLETYTKGDYELDIDRKNQKQNHPMILIKLIQIMHQHQHHKTNSLQVMGLITKLSSHL